MPTCTAAIGAQRQPLGINLPLCSFCSSSPVYVLSVSVCLLCVVCCVVYWQITTKYHSGVSCRALSCSVLSCPRNATSRSACVVVYCMSAERDGRQLWIPASDH